MKIFRSLLLPLLIALPTGHALAAWDETVNVIVDNPDELQGAKVSFAQTGGAVVEGEVQEDEDGNVFLYFPLSGDGPTAGTITVETEDGESEEFAVPFRSADSTLILDLDAGTVSVSAALGSPSRKSFEFRVGLTASQLSTDYLSGVSSGSASELGGVFAAQDVTEASINDSADDDAFGLGFSLTAAWPINDRSAFYVTGAYTESEEFEATVRGSGSVGLSDVQALNNIESELDITTLIFGYEHNFGGSWGIYGGAGYAHISTDLDFASTISVDGVPVSNVSGSENDDKDSWIIEAGVAYSVGSGPWRTRFGVSYIDEAFRGSDLTLFQIALQAGF